jgi:hypothetical protein
MVLCYESVRAAIQTVLPHGVPTQLINLALLTRAFLLKRSCTLSELARAYPRASTRRTPQPKHDLHYRLRRLDRFLSNPRLDPVTVQCAFIPAIRARLGYPPQIGLAVDWTMWDSRDLHGQKLRYQLLRVAIPRRGRALPLLQVVYNRDALPSGQSQNQLEEAAILAVVRALPLGVTPVVLADRGFARATLLTWVEQHGLDYVIRIDRDTVISPARGPRWKLGEESITPGDLQWHPQVRYGLYHDRPREVWIKLVCCWRTTARQQQSRGHRVPKEPWYLATSVGSAAAAVAWYRQRWWVEPSFRDTKGRFGLADTQVGQAERLGRLVVGLTLALAWLTLAVLPEVGAKPVGWEVSVAQWGRASVIKLALERFDRLGRLPATCLPQAP